MSVLSPSEEKRVYDNILGAIGKTPLVRLGRIAHDLACPLYAKMETSEPGRFGQGSGRAVHHRAGREARRTQTWRNGGGGYQWQYRRGAGDRLRTQGLQDHLRFARQDER